MKIKSESYKHLIAINQNNQLVDIPNTLMRKPLDLEQQVRKLSNNSVCIVCNYTFKDKPISFSPKIAAICHPFRETNFFPERCSKVLLSESDFYDENIVWNNNKGYDKKFDFFCFTINSEQGVLCKGLYMLPMIDQAAEIAGLNGVLVDYSSKYETYNHNSPSVTAINKVRKELKKLKRIKHVHQLMSPKEMCKLMKSCKFGIYPNNKDASPRLLVESIVRNVPVMVNENIFGGWKYINEQTGYFFSAPSMDEFLFDWSKEKADKFINETAEKMKQMMRFDNTNTSKNFKDRFGFENSSSRLAEVINNIDGTQYKKVAYVDFRKIMQRCLK